MIEFAALVLLANTLITLLLGRKGPTQADQLLAILLAGSNGVGILALVSVWQSEPALLDVALLLVALAAVLGSTFARRSWNQPESNND